MKLRVILPAPCPYNCVYCYKEGTFSERKDEMNISDLNFLIKESSKCGFSQLKLTGGEPTNFPYLKEIIEAAKVSNYADIRMTTIGLKLAERSFCEGLKASGLDGVTISVNSFNPMTYNKMMEAKDKDFEVMKKGLENAVKIFGHTVTLNTVLNRWNLSEIGELIDYASKKGLGVKILEMLDEEKKVPKRMYVSLNEFKKYYKLKEGKLINPTRELIRVGGARIYLVNSCCARKECKICRKGYDVVRITPDGMLKTCIANELSEINVYKQIKERNALNLEEKLKEVTDKFKPTFL